MAGFHATFSPSAIYRWVPCPGSIRAGQGLPDKPSIYAVEGTVAHGLAETALRKHMIQVRGVANPGDEVVAEGLTVKITDEMLDAVQVYLDIVYDFIFTNPDFQADIERRFSLSPVVPEVSGTADFVLYEEFGHGIILDYKHGRGHIVSQRNNPQLMAYALGAALELNLQTVAVGIIQPRVYSFSRELFQPEWYTTAELIKWAEETLCPAIKLAQSKNPPLNPGDHCTWCRAKLSCPALKAAVTSAFDDFTDDDLGIEPKAPDINALTPAQLGEIHAKAPMIRDFLEAVETRLKDGLKTGEIKSDTCGFKLVQGRKSPRRWADEEQVLNIVNREFDNPTIAVKTKLVTPTELEKRLDGKLPHTLLPLVTQDQTVAMVGIEDKRQELTSFRELFDNVEQ